MSWFETFAKHFRTQHTGLNEGSPEYKALLDIMALAMMADHHISLQERDVITTQLRTLAPQEPHPSEHLINQSVRVAYDMLGTPKSERLSTLKHIAANLSPAMRHTAYRAAAIIVRADDKIVPQESEYLSEVQEALELSDQQIERIIDAL